MASVKNAARNIDGTSQQLHQTLAEALGPDDQGINVSANIRQSLSNLNQATGNMAEDTEALKHSFFFRGFFKRRGYYNLNHLPPDQYRRDKVFVNPANRREWLSGEDLFQPGADGLETLSIAGKKRIDAAVAQFADSLVGGAVVVEGYSATQDRDEQFVRSRNRAILVSQYLRTHYHLDAQKIGAVSLRDEPPAGLIKDRWDGVCIVIFK